MTAPTPAALARAVLAFDAHSLAAAIALAVLVLEESNDCGQSEQEMEQHEGGVHLRPVPAEPALSVLSALPTGRDEAERDAQALLHLSPPVPSVPVVAVAELHHAGPEARADGHEGEQQSLVQHEARDEQPGVEGETGLRTVPVELHLEANLVRVEPVELGVVHTAEAYGTEATHG